MPRPRRKPGKKWGHKISGFKDFSTPYPMGLIFTAIFLPNQLKFTDLNTIKQKNEEKRKKCTFKYTAVLSVFGSQKRGGLSVRRSPRSFSYTIRYGCRMGGSGHLYLSTRMRGGSGTKPIRKDGFSRMGCPRYLYHPLR